MTGASYTPFPFAVPHVYVDISIQPGTTRVTSVVAYVPLDNNSSSSNQQPLHLRGEDLELVELSLNGKRLRRSAWLWKNKGEEGGGGKASPACVCQIACSILQGRLHASTVMVCLLVGVDHHCSLANAAEVQQQCLLLLLLLPLLVLCSPWHAAAATIVSVYCSSLLLLLALLPALVQVKCCLRAPTAGMLMSVSWSSMLRPVSRSSSRP